VTTHLLDTHCHVDAYDDPMAVLDDARRNEIDVVAVTEDPGRFRLLRTRLGRRPGVHLAIGLHPLRAADTATADLARLLRLLPQADWIGEIGLDFSRVGATTRHQQLRVFDALLAEPSVLRHPLTVHSRAAERETIRRLLQVKARAVLHWYTGPLAAAEEAISGGLWFSVNPSMVRSTRGPSLLAMLPPARVLLETDGPFARVGSRPARPSDIPAVLSHLSGIWKQPKAAVRAQIIDNQTRLLGELEADLPNR
jgi:TatD DNase family protein